jgi:hypothetical protein
VASDSMERPLRQLGLTTLVRVAVTEYIGLNSVKESNNTNTTHSFSPLVRDRE